MQGDKGGGSLIMQQVAIAIHQTASATAKRRMQVGAAG
jgi:hypothetical protein